MVAKPRRKALYGSPRQALAEIKITSPASLETNLVKSYDTAVDFTDDSRYDKRGT